VANVGIHGPVLEVALYFEAVCEQGLQHRRNIEERLYIYTGLVDILEKGTEPIAIDTFRRQ